MSLLNLGQDPATGILAFSRFTILQGLSLIGTRLFAVFRFLIQNVQKCFI